MANEMKANHQKAIDEVQRRHMVRPFGCLDLVGGGGVALIW